MVFLLFPVLPNCSSCRLSTPEYMNSVPIEAYSLYSSRTKSSQHNRYQCIIIASKRSLSNALRRQTRVAPRDASLRNFEIRPTRQGVSQGVSQHSLNFTADSNAQKQAARQCSTHTKSLARSKGQEKAVNSRRRHRCAAAAGVCLSRAHFQGSTGTQALGGGTGVSVCVCVCI